MVSFIICIDAKCSARIFTIYFFKKFFAINGNYSYNLLDRGSSTDPLIPAFNTPKNKFNIGMIHPRAEYIPPYAAKAVDSYFNWHIASV